MPASQTSTFTATGLPAPLNTAGNSMMLGYYTMKVTNPSGAVVREFSGKLYLNLDV